MSDIRVVKTYVKEALFFHHRDIRLTEKIEAKCGRVTWVLVAEASSACKPVFWTFPTSHVAG